jgi:organic radical activating enzyme
MTTDKIPIMEMFYTIQGEGFHTGRAAYFIRTGGCDIGCVWCDVKESWDANAHPPLSVEEIVNEVIKSKTDFVVITGGEPTMYDLTALTAALKKIGIEIALETSGAYPIQGHFDWICLSPKKFKMPLEKNYKLANELKMIIFNKSEKMLPLIINYVKDNWEWKISLQTHKFLNIP